jgi:GTP-binding protein YchF
MGFKMGIVGLPNVGKSTLFNALTQTAAAQAANYPFCTIEPNVGEVGVPDTRLDALASIAGSAQIIPTRLTFVDIAGLVRGASQGEGLGNQFLANIREVDAIAHVVRCFEDPDVTHVEGKIDPVNDIETIETELMLADLDSLRSGSSPSRRGSAAPTRRPRRPSTSSTLLVLLREGKARRLLERKPEEERVFQLLGLLTSKAGALRLQTSRRRRRQGQCLLRRRCTAAPRKRGAKAVVVSAKIESEIACCRPRSSDYLEAVGLSEPGLNRVNPGRLRAPWPLHLLHRRPEGGPGLDGDAAAPGRRKRPGSFTPTSRRVLFAPRPSRTRTM